MKGVLYYFFFVIFFPSLFFPQQLKTEVKGNTFTLNIDLRKQYYNDKKKGKFVVRSYYNATDPSKRVV